MARSRVRHWSCCTPPARKTGEERINPLMYLPDGDRYVVFASKGGHDYHPHWMLNIEANPDVEIEIGDRALQGQGRGTA